MAFVLDCSVTMTWVFPEESSSSLDALGDTLATEAAIVPEIWPFEVANTLLVALRRGRLEENEFSSLIAQLRVLPVEIDHDSGAQVFMRSLELARRYALTSYDASYLELASRRHLPLATLDKQLADACVSERVRVLN
ncbi:MAG: type II toxin-antitoxin system VapC family toxin [Gammaproteobacteria bacterium]